MTLMITRCVHMVRVRTCQAAGSTRTILFVGYIKFIGLRYKICFSYAYARMCLLKNRHDGDLRRLCGWPSPQVFWSINCVRPRTLSALYVTKLLAIFQQKAPIFQLFCHIVRTFLPLNKTIFARTFCQWFFMREQQTKRCIDISWMESKMCQYVNPEVTQELEDLGRVYPKVCLP